MMREEGAVCVSDEVQVGLGRIGSHFWGFQAHGVVSRPTPICTSREERLPAFYLRLHSGCGGARDRDARPAARADQTPLLC